MKSSINVVLTETSIEILSKNSLLTAIPLRQWTTTDGTLWSGRLRRSNQIDWLMGRLRATLQNHGPHSVMRLVSRVMSEEPPPPPPNKAPKPESSQDAKRPARTIRKAARRSPVARYMVGTKSPVPRTRGVEA